MEAILMTTLGSSAAKQMPAAVKKTIPTVSIIPNLFIIDAPIMLL
jgi:hypothetical protein